MILMGAGTNHWFHADTIYRAFLTLTTLCGTQGVNGGGWAHYVGQEKVRPITGYGLYANALDWSRPPRNMIQTAYWYLHTDQFRYDHFGADALAASKAGGLWAGMTTADVLAQSARLGWMPSYPTFDRNPLTLADDVAASGTPAAEYVPAALQDGSLRFAGEDPDAPENFPRVLTIWRSNLLGSSAKGNEYFLEHLLGTDSSLRARGGAARAPAARRRLEGRGSAREARPAADSRLPDDVDDGVQRRGPAGGHLVREVRPEQHRHASVRALVQPGHRPAVADPHRLRRVPRDRQGVQRARGDAPRCPPGPRRGAPDARHPGRDGDAVGDRARLEGGRVRPGAGSDDAEAGGRRAGLPGGRGQARRARAARVVAGCHHEGHHVRPDQAHRLPRPQERAGPRGRGRRAAVAAAGRARLRGDPRAVRHHQRAPGHRGVPHAGEAHGPQAGGPRGRARGQAGHVRGHAGGADAGHHVPRVVRLGVRRPAVLAVHHQRRAAQALAHPDGPAALLPRPRLDDRAGGEPAGVPTTPEHGGPVRGAAGGVERGARASRCGT